jgi:hypothetical protein
MAAVDSDLWYDVNMKKRALANKRPSKKGSALKVVAKKAAKPVHSRKAGPVIGRQRFEKISAVEGIVLTKHMIGRVREFDSRGASSEERRAAIIQAYRKA